MHDDPNDTEAALLRQRRLAAGLRLVRSIALPERGSSLHQALTELDPTDTVYGVALLATAALAVAAYDRGQGFEQFTARMLEAVELNEMYLTDPAG